MTDNELKFYDPETGEELHRVPEGATIPRDTPYGLIEDGKFWWHPLGHYTDLHQDVGVPRFTREPIAPPKPSLPTKPGAYLDKDGIAVELTDLGDWYVIGSSDERIWGVESRAPLTPASIVPTETWDRLRVIDPEDKRDRVDSNGCIWRYNKEIRCWDHENGTRFFTFEVVDRHFGPMRFADEVSD